MPGEVGIDVAAGGEVGAEQGELFVLEGVDRQRVGGRPGARAAGDEAEGLREQRGGGDAGEVGAGEGDAEVEFVGEQGRFDAVLGRLRQGEGDAGVAGVQLGGERTDQVGGEGRRDAQAQVAAGEVLDVVDGPFARGQVAQRAPGVVGVDGAGVGEPHRAAGAVQQLHAKGLLQLLDLLGERGLRDVQLLGGAGEVAVLGDGEEIAQVSQFQRGHGAHYRYEQ